MFNAVFLDRDGVINECPKNRYLLDWQSFVFLPKAKEAIATLSKTDYKIFVATNQRAIAQGLMTLDCLNNIHSRMTEEIRNSGGRIDRVYFCPHNERECLCRKPLPGMLDAASKEFSINFQNSWVIGNELHDIEMGKSRNCRTIFLGEQNPFSADFTAKDLYSAVSEIILK